VTAIVKHAGFSPANDLHYYHIYTDTGHVEYFWQKTFSKSGTYELDDRLFGENSGWITACCDGCGSIYRERAYWGCVIACTECGNPQHVPEGTVFEPTFEFDDEE